MGKTLSFDTNSLSTFNEFGLNHHSNVQKLKNFSQNFLFFSNTHFRGNTGLHSVPAAIYD